MEYRVTVKGMFIDGTLHRKGDTFTATDEKAKAMLELRPRQTFEEVTNDKDKSKEIGFAVGTGYYLGELNRTHFGGELKLGGGLFYRQNIDRRWSFNFGVHYF